MKTTAEEARDQMMDFWRYQCEQAKVRGEPLPPPPPPANASGSDTPRQSAPTTTETVPLWGGLTVTRKG